MQVDERGLAKARKAYDATHGSHRDALAAAILQPALERARQEERERCAMVADEYADAYHLEGAQYRSVAAAIRKGSGE